MRRSLRAGVDADTLSALRRESGHVAEAADLLDQVRGICTPLHALPMLADVAAHAVMLPRRDDGNLASGLTPREVEVLRLVAQGLTDAAVGQHLFISPRTVSQHLRSIYAKLDLPSRAAATRYAVEHRLT